VSSIDDLGSWCLTGWWNQATVLAWGRRYPWEPKISSGKLTNGRVEWEERDLLNLQAIANNPSQRQLRASKITRSPC